MRNWRLLLLAASLLASQPAWAEDEIRDSVVKIVVTQRGPDVLRPWTKAAPREISGSGAIIAGNRILTNAHVVRYASQIFVQASRSAAKAPAKVLAVGPEIDLAVITTEDPAFFEGRPALSLAQGIPRLKDTVNVYGYPIGGEQLSITEGIISRIEYNVLHWWGMGVRIQIEAALNPGNSGGPAVADGKIVGLVFSKFSQGENIGYLVASDEVIDFLADVEDGTYDGKPHLFDDLQPTENDALRAKLGLDENTGGVMVTNPFSEDESYPLEAWDVITRIGDHELDRRGRFRLREDLQLSYRYLVANLAEQGAVRLTVLRAGETREIEVPVRTDPNFLVRPLRGGYPRYFILGPLVFSSATLDLLETLGGSAVGHLAVTKSPLLSRTFDRRAFDGEELVTLGPSLLPHRISQGYGQQTLAVVESVNGVHVKNLAHLVETLRDASGEYVTLDMTGRHASLVFRRAELLESTEGILADEGIRNQCSDDLRGIWEEKQ